MKETKKVIKLVIMIFGHCVVFIKFSKMYHPNYLICEFVLQVNVAGETAQGTGPNKKLAKRAAAESLLQTLGYFRPSAQPGKPALKNSSSANAASSNPTNNNNAVSENGINLTSVDKTNDDIIGAKISSSGTSSTPSTGEKPKKVTTFPFHNDTNIQFRGRTSIFNF